MIQPYLSQHVDDDAALPRKLLRNLQCVVPFMSVVATTNRSSQASCKKKTKKVDVSGENNFDRLSAL